MNFFKVKNLIQICTKTHQIAPFIKIFSGGMPPNPPSKAHGEPCAACRFATCKFPNLKKKILGPPLPNPGDAPVIAINIVQRYTHYTTTRGVLQYMHDVLPHCLKN